MTCRQKQILIIKLGAIGDVVMALPFLQRLKKKEVNSKIDWLVGTRTFPFLKNILGIDKIYTVNEQALLQGTFFQKVKALFAAWHHIAFKNYDEIYLLHLDIRYTLLSMWTRGKKKRLSNSKNRLFFIPGRYHGSEYVRFFEGTDDHQKMPLEFPSLKEPSKTLDFATKALGKHFVLLCPGGNPSIEPGKELRMWPLSDYIEIAKRLNDDGFTVGLIGGPSDQWAGEQFVRNEKLIDLIGKLELGDIPLLMKEAHAVVTHDSGPMHFAVLAKAPLVALFGPTLAQEKLPLFDAGYTHRIRVHSGGKELTCRPCYDGKHYARCHNPICMKSIDVAAVYQSILEVMREEHCTRA